MKAAASRAKEAIAEGDLAAVYLAVASANEALADGAWRGGAASADGGAGSEAAPAAAAPSVAPAAEPSSSPTSSAGLSVAEVAQVTELPLTPTLTRALAMEASAVSAPPS